MRSPLFTLLFTIALPALTRGLANPDQTLLIRHGDDDDEHGHVPVSAYGAEGGGGAHHDHIVDVDTSLLVSSTASDHAAASSVHEHGHGHGHGHSHGSHEPAKTTLNDTDIHLWHHFPPSYLAADFRLDKDSAIFGEEFDEDWDAEAAKGQKVLMVVHVLAMCIAYFGALPIALALRAADHSAHYIANVGFLAVTAVGWLSGVAYKARTENRYEGAVHSGLGNMLVLLSIALAALDSVGLVKRVRGFWKQPPTGWRDFMSRLMRPSAAHRSEGYELAGLMEAERYSEDVAGRQTIFALGADEDNEHEQALPRRSLRSSEHGRPSLTEHLSRQLSPGSSAGSEGTLQESPRFSETGRRDSGHKWHHHRTGFFDASDPRGASPIQLDHKASSPVRARTSKASRVKRAVQISLTWIRRLQVVIAYVVTLTGLAMYTGMCRGGYVNGCAAHYIKGSIFFGYGVFTFSRYLGAYADLGWAWNRKPGIAGGPSAEMVECALIFTYGITNTWMERFDAAPGDPYTVKQVQHISIAVMFWFAGLSGMLLESKTIRRILGSAVSNGRHGDAVEPVTYGFSFNPLPPITIAITGLAMAAHHQDYVFQVEIHSLWGILLAGGSAFRILTYCFLYLRPPTESTLPSRPPTEILAAFGMAVGGIVFVLSDEEIMFAAMRAGYDDKMAFLNITVALTCLIFCWEIVVMAIKGAATLRVQHARKAEETESLERGRMPEV